MLLEQSDRILVLDGAMGTVLQNRFPGASNFETLNLTDPQAILSVHKAYIDAGADIIETNSFSANPISQQEYGLQQKAGSMALAAAGIARRAANEAGREILVAGSVGPTGKSLSLASDINDPSFRQYDFDDLVRAYSEQIGALAEGGVDLILIETCFDALNVKAALYAMDKLGVRLPAAVSVSVSDRSSRTLTGQTLEAFYRSVEHADLWAFGLNCSLGAHELTPLVEEVAGFAKCRVICYPNAGLPNQMGEYDQSPEQMAREMKAMAAKGILNIAGGCCGTTPEHIAAVAKSIQGCKARTIPANKDSNTLFVSGLESFTLDAKTSNFTNVGERTNVAGSRKFARLITEGQYDQALQIAADQIEGGASVIDINMDDAMLDSAKQMKTFLRYISNDPAVAKAALMIDSSDWSTVIEGLKNAQGKCIVNSISLKEGEDTFLEKALEIKRLGGAMIVMAFDEQGQATSFNRKIQICSRAYNLLTKKACIPACDIIFDVNVLAVGTGIDEHRRYGVDFIEAVRWIKSNLSGVRTSGGISNLSFSFRGNNAVREAMHSAFLYHATEAGLDMGIVNPGMLQVYSEIEPDMLEKVEDVILDRRDDATERLIAKAQQVLSSKDQTNTVQSPTASASQSAPTRLSASLVRGSAADLEKDVMECLQLMGSAVAVIEGPLMAGMQTVGDNFGAGRMFLPQVVKSAKIMRDAVAILSPYMSLDDGCSVNTKPKAIIATVKGDVHDIGKNITAIVLTCNGFDVTDLGVMVPKETILETAARTGADIIGVSGLITPSLYQMEELCREMSARGLSTPLFVGGATASAVHTAVKLSPLYKHVFYGPDASATAVMAKKCLIDREGFEAQEHSNQERIRKAALSYASTAAPRERIEFEERSYLRGQVFEDIPFRELSLEEVMPFFDWRMFFATWRMKSDSSLRTEAEMLLAHLQDTDALSLRVAAKFFEAVRDEDDIVFGSHRIPMLRQPDGKCLSLADFVAAKGSAQGSAFGVFAASVHTRSTHCNCPQCSDNFEPMLLRSVKVTLVEAVSSWMDDCLEKQLPSGCSAKIIKPAAGYSCLPDHSLKRNIMELLPDSERLGIEFTESYAMIPDASICGLVFAHPEASYPQISKLRKDVIETYAKKRGMTEQESRRFLGHLLPQ